MFVFLLTSPTLNSKGNEEKKETLKKYIIQYIDLKPILLAWKQNQLSLQKICQDYYNSFLGKIRYDKIRSLYKRINSYIDMRNKLLSESFAEVKKPLNWDFPGGPVAKTPCSQCTGGHGLTFGQGTRS